MPETDAPDPQLDPAEVIDAALHQLAAEPSAEGDAEHRGQLLRLGLTAASVLAGQRAEARRWARRLWHALTEDSGASPMPQVQQAPAWVRQPTDSAPGHACSPVLQLAEAEHGHGRCWTLVPLTEFRPELVYPGAEVTAAAPEGHEPVIVVSTALWATAGHEVTVLVTFHRHTATTGAQP